MKNKKIKEWIMEAGFVLVGNLIVALGVTFFILPSDILSGGTAGIAVALADPASAGDARHQCTDGRPVSAGIDLSGKGILFEDSAEHPRLPGLHLCAEPVFFGYGHHRQSAAGIDLCRYLHRCGHRTGLSGGWQHRRNGHSAADRT